MTVQISFSLCLPSQLDITAAKLFFVSSFLVSHRQWKKQYLTVLITRQLRRYMRRLSASAILNHCTLQGMKQNYSCPWILQYLEQQYSLSVICPTHKIWRMQNQSESSDRMVHDVYMEYLTYIFAFKLLFVMYIYSEKQETPFN